MANPKPKIDHPAKGMQIKSNDLAEPKQTETEIDLFFKLSPDMLCIANIDGYFKRLNPAFVQTLGWTMQELLAQPFLDFVHPDDRPATLAEMGKLRQSAMAIYFENRFRCRDGSYKWLAWNSQSGPEGRLYTIARDITERKRVEESQRENEMLFRQIVASISDHIYVTSVTEDGHLVNLYLSPQVTALTGYPWEEFAADWSFWPTRVIHPEDRATAATQAARLAKGQNSQLEYRLMRANGEVIWVRDSGQAIKDPAQPGHIIYGVVNDITESKRAEEELRKLSRAVEQSPSTIVITNIEGYIEYANPKFTETTGYTLEEAIGQHTRILKSDETSAEEYKQLWETLLAGNEWHGEFHNKKKNSELYWESASISPIKNTAGVITHFLAVKEEITEKKQAEDALAKRALELEEATNFLNSVIDNLPTMLFVKEAEELRFARWNKAGEELTGFTREEFLGKNDYDFFPKKEADFFTAKDREVLNEGKLLDIPEESIQTKHQGTRLLHTRKIPIYGLDGKPKYLLGISEDITERKKAEEALQESQRLLQGFIENSEAIIYVKDLQGRYLLVNSHFETLFHFDQQQVVGKTDYEVFPKELAEELQANDRKVIQANMPLQWEEVAPVDGELRTYLSLKFPLFDSAGVPYAIGGISTNITDRKQIEEALAKRSAELETVAQVSTAIATILDTAELLQTVSDLVKERFGLYHAHIYLLNETEDTLVLAAGAGEVGRQMIARGWSIPLEKERSLVAQAMRTRRGVIINDVRQEPNFLPNPLLPETQAEMAIPLIAGEQVLGVLDVQANVVNYFTQEDERIQTILARQVVGALQNTHLFTEQQQARLLLDERVKELNCLNEIGREIVETPLVADLLQWVTERIPPAMCYPELCMVAIEYDDQIYGAPAAIDLPCQIVHALRIGGEVMGRIYISYTEKRDFLDEESALIGGIAGRLSGYIESQRLLEQIQDALATQEHLAVELDSQRRTLQAVLDNMPAGVFVAEAPSGKPVLANEQLKQLLGRGIALDVKKKETAEMYAIYRYGTDTLYPPDQTPLARGLLGESIIIDDMEVRQPNGSRTLLQVVGAPIRDTQGSISASVAIFQDITERRQAEETLRQNEALLRTVIDSTPDWIFIKDQNHRYRLVNRSYAASMHLSPEDFVDKNDLDIGFPEDIVKGNSDKGIRGFWADDREVMDSGETKFIAEEPAVVDGELIWLSTIKVPLRDAQNQVSGVLGFVHHITERKRTEVELRASQERLSEALNIAKLTNWELDVATQTFTFNDQFYSLLRTTAEQEGGYLMPAMQYAQKFVHPHDVGIVGVTIKEALETTDPNYLSQFEHRIIRADGSEGYMLVRFRVVKDEQGQTVKTIGANQDITERKQAEEALRKSQEQLSETLQTAKLAYWEFDLESQNLTFNDQFYAIFKTTAELEGGYVMPAAQYTQKYVHPEDAGLIAREIQMLAESNDPNYTTQLGYRIIRADGEEGYLEVQFRRAERGQTIGAVGIIQDITERKRAELDREKLLAEVEVAYRQYVRQEWQQFLGEQHQGNWRIEYQQVNSSSAEVELSELDKVLAGVQNEVISEGKTKIITGTNGDNQGEEAAVIAPIILRGQVIGTFSLQDLTAERQWAAEEIALVEAVSEQLGVTIENLRLFDDTQKQATREQLTRQITDRMRAAPDVESIIQTGLTELGKALGVSRSYVKLTPKE